MFLFFSIRTEALYLQYVVYPSMYSVHYIVAKEHCIVELYIM